MKTIFIFAGIFVKIEGKAKCSWKDGDGEDKKTYNGEESYLDEGKYFVGEAFGELIFIAN